MGRVVNATLRPNYPRERPGTHCTKEGVGPRAGLDGCAKSHPPPGFEPRNVQPVASRYTDWAIPRYNFNKIEFILQLGTSYRTLSDKYNKETSHGWEWQRTTEGKFMKYIIICECRASYLLRYLIWMTHKCETWRRCVLTFFLLCEIFESVNGHRVQDRKNRSQGALEENTKYFSRRINWWNVFFFH